MTQFHDPDGRSPFWIWGLLACGAVSWALVLGMPWLLWWLVWP